MKSVVVLKSAYRYFIISFSQVLSDIDLGKALTLQIRSIVVLDLAKTTGQQ